MARKIKDQEIQSQEGLSDEDRDQLETEVKEVSARSAAQLGKSKASVKVKVGDTVYSNLTKALAAHGFDKVKDWPKVRNQLKKDGLSSITTGEGDNEVKVVFETTDEDITSVSTEVEVVEVV